MSDRKFDLPFYKVKCKVLNSYLKYFSENLFLSLSAQMYLWYWFLLRVVL